MGSFFRRTNIRRTKQEKVQEGYSDDQLGPGADWDDITLYLPLWVPEMVDHILCRKPVNAIKLVRDSTGANLKTAKAFVGFWKEHFIGED